VWWAAVFVGGERSVGRCRMDEARRGSMPWRGATTVVGGEMQVDPWERSASPLDWILDL
jgi:hypothetical protein